MASKQISLRNMLAFWLVAMIVLPTLPVAAFTWHGYRNELRQLERQLQDTNRQFTVLAGTLLNSILQETAQRLQRIESPATRQENLPFDHIEIVSSDGRLLESTLNPQDIGQPYLRKPNWRSLETPGGRPFEITDETFLPELGDYRVLVKVVTGQDPSQIRIAILDPDYLRSHLTSRFQSLINRHIYAVDAKGFPIFYSDPGLSQKPRGVSSQFAGSPFFTRRKRAGKLHEFHFGSKTNRLRGTNARNRLGNRCQRRHRRKHDRYP